MQPTDYQPQQHSTGAAGPCLSQSAQPKYAAAHCCSRRCQLNCSLQHSRHSTHRLQLTPPLTLAPPPTHNLSSLPPLLRQQAACRQPPLSSTCLYPCRSLCQYRHHLPLSHSLLPHPQLLQCPRTESTSARHSLHLVALTNRRKELDNDKRRREDEAIISSSSGRRSTTSITSASNPRALHSAWTSCTRD